MDVYEKLQGCRIVECSHLLSKNTPLWPGDVEFYRCPLASYEVSGYFKEFFIIPEGFGTHMDSPAHFFPGKRTASEITPQELIAKCVLVDVADRCAGNPDYELQLADIEAWEGSYGLIPAGALVCMRTGWGEKIHSKALYYNSDSSTVHPGYPGGTMHFPGFSEAVAQFLVAHRSIVGIGIDTLSLDPGISTTFSVHQVILGADKYQLENMRLQDLPASGAVLVISPVRIEQAVESPVRVLGFIP